MPGGRPTVMTPETIDKLEYAFALGCSDEEACFYADISKTTLYEYTKKHPEFTDRKEILKQRPVLKAREVIIGALDNADVQTAHKVIDRKDGLPKQRSEISGPNGGALENKWVVEVVEVGKDKE